MQQHELFKSIYASNLKSRAVNVMSCLITYMNGKDNTCFPSIKTIAKCCSMGVSTVKRALADLVEAGFVEKEARFVESKNMAQTSNLYRLSASITEPQPPKGEESTTIACESQVTETQEYAVVTFDSITTENAALEKETVVEEAVVDENIVGQTQELDWPISDIMSKTKVQTFQNGSYSGEVASIFSTLKTPNKSKFSNKWTGEQSILIPP